jgi:hypothetical protein
MWRTLIYCKTFIKRNWGKLRYTLEQLVTNTRIERGIFQMQFRNYLLRVNRFVNIFRKCPLAFTSLRSGEKFIFTVSVKSLFYVISEWGLTRFFRKMSSAVTENFTLNKIEKLIIYKVYKSEDCLEPTRLRSCWLSLHKKFNKGPNKLISWVALTVQKGENNNEFWVSKLCFYTFLHRIASRSVDCAIIILWW